MKDKVYLALMVLSLLPASWFVVRDLVATGPDAGLVEDPGVDREGALGLADAADRRVGELRGPLEIMIAARPLDEAPVPESLPASSRVGPMRGALADLADAGRASALVRALVEAERGGGSASEIVPRLEALKDRADLGPPFPGRAAFFGVLERRLALWSRSGTPD